MTKRAMMLSVTVLLAVGCGTQGTSSTTGSLTLEESAGRATGSFTDTSAADLGRVDFTSHFVDTNQLEVELRFHGMVVSELVDFTRGVVEFDGYAADGSETQMLEDDHQLLLEFAHALDRLGDHVSDPVARARDFASQWSEFPMSMGMQFQSQMPVVRGAASLCGYVNSYVRGTHDCWATNGDCPDGHWYLAYADKGCVNGNDASTIDYTYMSMHAGCSGGTGVDDQTTWFWNGNAWTCPGSEPDHDMNIEYAYGDCFGRCGSGCGSGHVFSVNCLNHDVCNRFGHSWASSIPGGGCADEFADAAIEEVAEPNCF